MKKLYGVFVLVFVLTACIASVHPFYFEKDVVMGTPVVGPWEAAKPEDGDGMLWHFEPGEDKSLKLTVTERGNKKGFFTAYLFKLDNDYFLDLAARECEFATNQVDMVAASLIRGHLLLAVVPGGSSLKMAVFDGDWLEKFLKENPKALSHFSGDQLVLTADTAQLQKFVMEHKKDLFGQAQEFKRKPESKGQ